MINIMYQDNVNLVYYSCGNITTGGGAATLTFVEKVSLNQNGVGCKLPLF